MCLRPAILPVHLRTADPNSRSHVPHVGPSSGASSRRIVAIRSRSPVSHPQASCPPSSQIPPRPLLAHAHMHMLTSETHASYFRSRAHTHVQPECHSAAALARSGFHFYSSWQSKIVRCTVAAGLLCESSRPERAHKHCSACRQGENSTRESINAHTGRAMHRGNLKRH